MIRTYYRRPTAADDPAVLFASPPAPITDPLTGVAPTWRMTEEPIYRATVRDLGIPGLGAGAAGDVVEGVIVDGPPTVVLDVAGPPTRPLPVLEHRKPARKRAPRRGRQRQRQREAGRGELLLLLFVVVVACVVALTTAGFLRGVEQDIRRIPACVVPTAAGCSDGPQS